MAPSIIWLQVLLPAASMACKAPAVPRAAPRWQRCLSREPVLSKALLPPDEEYGRDRKTRCNAEIRPVARYGFRRLSMIIRFETETSALLTPRAARRHGRCVRDAYRARAAASVVTPPRRSPTYSSAHKKSQSPAQETNRRSASRGRWTKRLRSATTTRRRRASTSKIR